MSPSRRRGSDDAGMVVFLVGAGMVLLAIAWPWIVGTYLAVQFGADNPSPAVARKHTDGRAAGVPPGPPNLKGHILIEG
jgi:hypothetical protein